jgi:hypothetical protein
MLENETHSRWIRPERYAFCAEIKGVRKVKYVLPYWISNLNKNNMIITPTEFLKHMMMEGRVSYNDKTGEAVFHLKKDILVDQILFEKSMNHFKHTWGIWTPNDPKNNDDDGFNYWSVKMTSIEWGNLING